MRMIIAEKRTNLSKMWNKVLNLETTLFPALKEELRVEALSGKEQKLIKILDFAEIEKNITVVKITNTPKANCPPNPKQQRQKLFIYLILYI